jgi:hypothetical protein
MSFLNDVASNFTGRPQARAIRDAAKIQSAAGDKAASTISGMYDKSRADLSPWVMGGAQAGSELQGMLAPGGQLRQTFNPFTFDVNSDPGAQFRLEQANKAFERSAAGRGRSMGGGAARSLAEFNQGLASQEYGNAYNRYNTDRAAFNEDQGNLFARLFGLSQQGQQGAGALANLNTQSGDTLANIFQNIGNVQGGAKVAGANARSQATSGLLNLLMQGGAIAALA